MIFQILPTATLPADATQTTNIGSRRAVTSTSTSQEQSYSRLLALVTSEFANATPPVRSAPPPISFADYCARRTVGNGSTSQCAAAKSRGGWKSRTQSASND